MNFSYLESDFTATAAEAAAATASAAEAAAATFLKAATGAAVVS